MIKFCRYQYCYKDYTLQGNLSVEQNSKKFSICQSLHLLEDKQLQSDIKDTIVFGMKNNPIQYGLY